VATCGEDHCSWCEEGKLITKPNILANTETPSATAQELLDPNNCAAQGIKIGGGYECAPLDAGAIADTSEAILRERQQLSEDGMLIVVARVNARGGKLLGPRT
jgi:hypothetical protein